MAQGTNGRSRSVVSGRVEKQNKKPQERERTKHCWIWMGRRGRGDFAMAYEALGEGPCTRDNSGIAVSKDAAAVCRRLCEEQDGRNGASMWHLGHAVMRRTENSLRSYVGMYSVVDLNPVLLMIIHDSISYGVKNPHDKPRDPAEPPQIVNSVIRGHPRSSASFALTGLVETPMEDLPGHQKSRATLSWKAGRCSTPTSQHLQHLHVVDT